MINGIKSAEYWQRKYRQTRRDTYPSVKFIQEIQADALRVAGNTAATPNITKRKAATAILAAASELEYLSLMLSATTPKDKQRLKAIAKRLNALSK